MYSLKGEQNFSLRSVKDSSNAYDQHLLSKIGNSLSPRTSISQASDHRGSISALTVPSISSRASSNLPSPGVSDAGSTIEMRWFNSPQADAVSPRSKARWPDYIEGRSPSEDSNTPSVIFDHDSIRDGGRRRYQGATPSREDSISLPSRSHRGSYDLGVFSDIDSELPPADDLARPRQFVLREPTPPYPDGSKQGMKRRASSPPRELMGGPLHLTTSNGDLSQRRTSGQPFANTLSVNTNYSSNRRALSASSSLSIRTSGSYSSTLSIGGSSMTSLSPYDRPSPGGLSPCSDLDTYHEKSILNANPSAPMLHAVPRSIHPSSTLEPPAVDSTGKVSLPLSVPKITHGSRMSGLYICECCPKKPKKFDNPDDLRYVC